MNRIEKIGNATLYLGDCREVMRTLSPVDAVVSDPPYGINENDKKVASRGKIALPTDYGKFDWDKNPADEEQVELMRKLSKWQILFGGNYFQLPPTSCWLVWDKQNGDNDFADCELAWTNMPKAVRIFRWTWNGMIRTGHEKRYHPTQKPLALMEWCISKLPEDVASICDPFMGSGTTGVAAISAGKSFIGVEQWPEQFDIACKRISEAVKSPGLF